MSGFVMKGIALEKPWSGYLEWKDPDVFPESDWDTENIRLKDGTPKEIAEKYNAYVQKQKRKMERARREHKLIFKE